MVSSTPDFGGPFNVPDILREAVASLIAEGPRVLVMGAVVLAAQILGWILVEQTAGSSFQRIVGGFSDVIYILSYLVFFASLTYGLHDNESRYLHFGTILRTTWRLIKFFVIILIPVMVILFLLFALFSFAYSYYFITNTYYIPVDVSSIIYDQNIMTLIVSIVIAPFVFVFGRILPINAAIVIDGRRILDCLRWSWSSTRAAWVSYGLMSLFLFFVSAVIQFGITTFQSPQGNAMPNVLDPTSFTSWIAALFGLLSMTFGASVSYATYRRLMQSA